MATCEHCAQEMMTADGCMKRLIEVNNRLYVPIHYGKGTWGAHMNQADQPRCHDCNCIWGAMHHPGCDMEECPHCHGQLISCGCTKDRLTIDDTTTRQALEAAEQCITDFIEVYKRGCSMLVLDEAVKSLRDDALTKVRAALKQQEPAQ